MLRKFIASQFKRPTGLLGIWASNVMIKGNEKCYNKLIKDLDLQPHDKLLEIGYGPGRGIHTIAELCPTCTIHGIDFSPLMFTTASKHNKANIEKGSVLLHRGDFLKLGLADNDYDKVFCLNVVYFWNDLREPFAKIFSVLKNSGSFHIYMADKDTLMKKKAPDSVFNKYSMEQVADALEAAGFTAVEHTVEKGYYVKAKK
jgi:ubiquinone/menaquinone biosynthesis C-methylase UbiE